MWFKISTPLIRVVLSATICCCVALAPSDALAQARCGSLSVAKKPVCEAAVTAQQSLQRLQEMAPQSCALTPVSQRLELLLAELPVVDGLLAEEFTARTESIRSEGMEFAQTVLFFGDPDLVILESEEGAPFDTGVCYASSAESPSLREATSAVEKAIAAYNKPMLISGAARLRKLANTWSWLITDGFGQFPWERAFNDLVHREPLSIYRLPTIEWVLLHPGVGVELTNVDELREVRGKTMLFLEPLGFIRYRFDVSREKRGYWGASTLVVLTDDATPGLGGLIRYNKYSVGVVRHRRSGQGGGNWALTATVELLERTQSARKKLQQGGAKAMKVAEGR